MDNKLHSGKFLPVLIKAMILIPLKGSPYKTVQVNNFRKLHITASGSTWRKIRYLQGNTGRYFQTCIALYGLPAILPNKNF
jgi:hypothetical protein